MRIGECWWVHSNIFGQYVHVFDETFDVLFFTIYFLALIHLQYQSSFIGYSNSGIVSAWKHHSVKKLLQGVFLFCEYFGWSPCHLFSSLANFNDSLSIIDRIFSANREDGIKCHDFSETRDLWGFFVVNSTYYLFLLVLED